MPKPELMMVVAGYAKRTFDEGSTDCALFQADCVRAMFGRDPALPYRGRYTTYRRGLALLRADGYRRPRDYTIAHAKRVHHSSALTGDLTYRGAAGGVVIDGMVYELSRAGLTCQHLDADFEVWRWQA